MPVVGDIISHEQGVDAFGLHALQDCLVYFYGVFTDKYAFR